MSKPRLLEPLAKIGHSINAQFADLEEVNIDAVGSRFDSLRKAIVNERQRFQLWAGSMGLCRRGHRSLDYRLRDSKLVLDYTLGLLRDLHETIADLETELKKYPKPEEHDRSSNISHATLTSEEKLPASDSDSDEDLLSYKTDFPPGDVLVHVISIIERLYRLALKIDSLGLQSGLPKTLDNVQSHLSAESEAIHTLRNIDRTRIIDLLHANHSRGIDMGKDYLVQRLVNANADRRRRLEHWKHHRQDFAAISEPKTTDIASSISALELETYNLRLSDDSSDLSSCESISLASRSDHWHEAPFPKPPPLELGVDGFECPYCCTFLSSKKQKGDQWLSHVFHDLRPYVCTFPNCRDPDQQYESFQDWVVHEFSQHLANTEASLQVDSGERRVNKAAGNLLESIAARNCLFCEDQNASAAHIGSHLRRIACFTLSVPFYSPNEKDLNDQEARNVEEATIHEQKRSPTRGISHPESSNSDSEVSATAFEFERSESPSSANSVWYCCECNFGPHNSSLYQACISCGSDRCSFCTEMKLGD